MKLMLILILMVTSIVVSTSLGHERADESSACTAQVAYIPIDMADVDTFTVYLVLDMLMSQDNIDGIIIHLEGESENRGEGSSIAREIRRAATQKPVVALIDEKCTHACYHVAAASNHITASPFAQIGSIGVLTDLRDTLLSLLINTKADQDNQGGEDAKTQVETARRASMLFNQWREQYHACIDEIAQYRDLTPQLEPETTPEWVQEVAFSAKQAKSHTLIDSIGSFHEAFAAMNALLQERGITDSDCVINLMEVTNNNGDDF